LLALEREADAESTDRVTLIRDLLAEGNAKRPPQIAIKMVRDPLRPVC
jgi:hypothetical protein